MYFTVHTYIIRDHIINVISIYKHQDGKLQRTIIVEIFLNIYSTFNYSLIADYADDEPISSLIYLWDHYW